MKLPKLNKKRCPTCGADRIPIVYGFPGPELILKEKAGQIYLGGCVIRDTNPQFHCPNCDKETEPEEGELTP